VTQKNAVSKGRRTRSVFLTVLAILSHPPKNRPHLAQQWEQQVLVTVFNA
jgi:hypothetical protein